MDKGHKIITGGVFGGELVACLACKMGNEQLRSAYLREECPAKTSMDKDIEKWEEEFVETWYCYNLKTSTPAGAEKEAVQFIRQLLTQQKESIREKVEGIFKIPTFCGKCNWGGKLCKECYADRRANAALQEVIILLAK